MATVAGARPIKAPGWSGGAHTDLALIDCDVHQVVRDFKELHPYLPRAYQQLAIEQGIAFPGSGYFNINRKAARADLSTDCDAPMDNYRNHDGRQFGSDEAFARAEHLDLWNLDYALLTGASVYGASMLPDPDWAAALCRAFNDYTMEHWAAKDPRWLVSLAVSTTDPRLAVEEINRLGDHPQVRGVTLTTGAHKPYGNRHYHPIWEACAAHNLAVVIHPGNEGAGMAGPPTGVGYPTYYIENRMARPQMAMAHAVSFIAEGVFEKYPTLKVLFDEVDQFWAVGLMWHMDADWKSLRDQTPWVKKLPSEYFRGHIRVGSQPMLEPENREQFFQMLEMLHADETLVYASDWPHWDWDDPATTFPRLPDHLHKRFFAETARDLLGL